MLIIVMSLVTKKQKTKDNPVRSFEMSASDITLSNIFIIVIFMYAMFNT